MLKKLWFLHNTKHFFLSDDGYYTFFMPCMDNTIDSKVRFCLCFLQIERFYCVSWRTHSATAFFILLIAYSLNKNKPQFLATFENRGCEVAKQLINFLAVLGPDPFKKSVLCIITSIACKVCAIHNCKQTA